MSDWRINFCENLKHLRQVHGLTQVEMAKILEINVHTYRKMEHCAPKVRIHSGHIQRIRDHFDVKAAAILEQNWQQMLEGK